MGHVLDGRKRAEERVMCLAGKYKGSGTTYSQPNHRCINTTAAGVSEPASKVDWIRPPVTENTRERRA
jgi:hypothetical protein